VLALEPNKQTSYILQLHDGDQNPPSMHPIRCFQTVTVPREDYRNIVTIDHPAESRQAFNPLQRQSVLLPPRDG
jgi:hypothetical protein